MYIHVTQYDVCPKLSNDHDKSFIIIIIIIIIIIYMVVSW